jgi:hypothetical protein
VLLPLTVHRTYASLPRAACLQNLAFVGRLGETPSLPFEVLNGTPGYINLLDAANAWQLAAELRAATGLAAAASFKHVSPAGAAVAVPLSDVERVVYEAGDKELTPVALAYMRARNADPMCSFGDFAAVSDVVDEATALLLKPEVRARARRGAAVRPLFPRCPLPRSRLVLRYLRALCAPPRPPACLLQVSDGIVAPGFTPAALDILKAKKSGAFIILKVRGRGDAEAGDGCPSQPLPVMLARSTHVNPLLSPYASPVLPQAVEGFVPPAMEFREVYGMAFAQVRDLVW